MGLQVVKSEGVSPSFSSSEENPRCNSKVQKPKKRRTRLTRKSRKSSRRSTKHHRCSKSADDSAEERIPDMLVDCNEDVRTANIAQEVTENPLLEVEHVSRAFSFPEVRKENENSSNKIFVKFPGASCTPVHCDMAKASINNRFLLTHGKLPSASQLSSRSQDSGKSSCKSALTSTPLDKSRINSVRNSFGPWNSADDELISPVPREGFITSKVVSPSVFESPLSNCLKTLSLSNRKSRDNPSYDSQYHTCFSENCKSNNCSKKMKYSAEYQKHVIQETGSLCEEPLIVEKRSAQILEKAPLKKLVIPIFDIEGEINKKSLKDELSLNGECSVPEVQIISEVKLSPKIIEENNISAEKSVSSPPKRSNVVSGRDALLSDLSKNLSVEKKKQIKSFLNQPSFSIPLRSRQKRKFSRNKVEPLPLVKRLTRHSARLSVMRKNMAAFRTESEPSFTSHKDSASSDESGSEMSYVVPRRAKYNLISRATTRQRSKLSKEDINSSGDSAVIPRKSFARGASFSSFVKPSPVLGRRASVRLAMKRTSEKRKITCYGCKNLGSCDENTSCRFGAGVHVATRASTRRQQMKLSIMQFSLSSVKSTNSDLEESKASIASNCVSGNESDSVRSEEKHSFSLRSEMSNSALSVKSNLAFSHVLSAGHLESQVIEEEPEDTIISNENSTILSTEENVCSEKLSTISKISKSDSRCTYSMTKEEQDYDLDQETRNYVDSYREPSGTLGSTLETEPSNIYGVKEEAKETSIFTEDDTSVIRPTENNCQNVRSSVPPLHLEHSSTHDESVSEFDVSMDDNVFTLPFQAPLPIKRGKGWIRSLSIARVSN